MISDLTDSADADGDSGSGSDGGSGGESEGPRWELGKYHGADNTFLVHLIEVPPNSFDEIEARATTDLATSLEDLLANNAGVLHPENPPLKGQRLASIATGICGKLPKIGEAGETSGGYVDGLIVGLCAFPLPDSTSETNQTNLSQDAPLKVGMLLRNADGSDGQVSGNGLCCLGHAVLRAFRRASAELKIFTASGLRLSTAIRGPDFAQSVAANAAQSWDAVVSQVRMGDLELSDSVTPAGDPEIEEAVKDTIRRAARAIVFTPADHSTETHSTEKGFRNAAYGTIGNPHLVIDAGDVSQALDTIADNPPNANVQVLNYFKAFGNLLTYELKRAFGLKQEPYPEGINVEFISAVPMENAINMIVWERGVGITKACGTGAVVAAAQAAKWGLVDGAALIEVRMPGGHVEVLLPQARENDGPEPVLTGYSDYVEDHTYDFHSHELT